MTSPLAANELSSNNRRVPPTVPCPRAGLIRDCLWLGLFSALVFLPALSQERQWANREVRHAEIIREMAQSGDYLVPTLLGEVYYDKPPVMHAIAAWLTRHLGEPRMWIARLPSAIAALVTVLATYGAGRLLFDRPTAMWSGCVLLGFPGFCWMAREARPDMILCMAIVLSCLTFGLGMTSRDCKRRAFWFGTAGLATGLGLITKGPLGLLFPLCFVWLAAFHRVEWKRPRLGWLAFLGGVVVAVSVWAVPAYLRDNGEYLRHVVFQPDLDVTGEDGEPFYSYVVWLVVLNLPLMLLLPVAILDIRRRGYSAPLAMAAAIFTIVTLIPKKRRHYLVPAYPFLALSLGSTIVHHFPHHRWMRRAAWTLVPLGMLITPLYFGVVLPLTHAEEPTKQLVDKAVAQIDPSADVYAWKPFAEPLAWVGRRHEGIFILGDDDDALYTRERRHSFDKQARQEQRRQRMLADIRAARTGSYLLLPSERLASVREELPTVSYEQVASFPFEGGEILLVRLK